MTDTDISTADSATTGTDISATNTPAAETTTGDKDWKAEAERLKAESRKWEDRAKANTNAAKELERLKAEGMTAQEKAVAEAEKRGHDGAVAKAATRLATAEFKAAAAGRVEKDALEGFLKYADMAKFLGDDGEPDGKAIEGAVKALAGSQRTPDFDGGARTSASKTTDMNQLIRQKAGLV